MSLGFIYKDKGQKNSSKKKLKSEMLSFYLQVTFVSVQTERYV